MGNFLKYLIPKALLCFLFVFILTLILTKIGGEFPNYPPVEKRALPWADVVKEIPFITIKSTVVTIIFSIGLYWHWLNKGRI